MTTQKFMRNYRLTIWPIDGGDPIIVRMPTTIKVSCLRALLGGMNTLSIDIYNLSELHRRNIYQDPAVPGYYSSPPTAQNPRFFNILFEGGYGDDTQLHQIFYGHMLWADSWREGSNIITHIEATSALPDVLGTQIQVTLSPPPITAAQILTYLVNQLPNIRLGALGNFTQQFTRPVALNGIVWDLIRRYAAPGTPFIDNGKIYILNNNEVTGGVFTINEATGILETPRRQFQSMYVTTLFEPGVEFMGQQVQLQSSINPFYNGIFKVLGVRHEGMISGAICGKMTSTFYLQAPGWFNGPPGTLTPGSGFTVIPLAKAVAA